MSFLMFAVILAASAMLTGCGKKGPLYLPKPNEARNTAAEMPGPPLSPPDKTAARVNNR
jgi:predicted small lipoprotein YifL